MHPGWANIWIAATWFVAAAIVSGCATYSRLPAPPVALSAAVMPLSIPNARFRVDGDDGLIRKEVRKAYKRGLQNRGHTPLRFLALSGGGDEGAYGAGLLNGWTKSGSRPHFDVVTGVSTGALSAPFAFLGPRYDHYLKKIYTATSAEDVFEQRGILVGALAGDAVTGTAPLRRMVHGYLTPELMEAIAVEYRKGRLLLVLSTNLDQGVPIIWNIGAIADSHHPGARDLITDVLLASAAIPGAFPPVMIDIAADSQHFQEMHVDGGIIAQAFLYPAAYSPRRLRALPREAFIGAQAYIIRNGRLISVSDSQVDRSTIPVSLKAVSTMIAMSGFNDTYRIYATSQRDGVGYNLAFIGDDFDVPYSGPFDKSYMNKLYDYGYAQALSGYRWAHKPPGL